jgi:hypothetical protein
MSADMGHFKTIPEYQTMKKILPIIFLFFTLNSYSANWKYIDDGWLIDTTSIQRQSNGNIRVWFKHINPPEVITNMTNELRKIGVYKDYSNYSYTLSLFEINCSQRVHRVISGVDYTPDGKIIDSFELPNSKFSSVLPESEGENNYKYVCKKR